MQDWIQIITPTPLLQHTDISVSRPVASTGRHPEISHWTPFRSPSALVHRSTWLHEVRLVSGGWYACRVRLEKGRGKSKPTRVNHLIFLAVLYSKVRNIKTTQTLNTQSKCLYYIRLHITSYSVYSDVWATSWVLVWLQTRRQHPAVPKSVPH